ncbi:MAG: sigma-70 family RNA polymerase sigma factor [Planctomycetes bacterium]|nr:sigma-70 family RNA polymerase sigma factor [Planctomycetota bacterium]
MKSLSDSDEDLVRRARDGESEAYSVLFLRYRATVLSLALAKIRDREGAEDIVQDVFLVAWESLGDLSYADRFAGWILGIARNLCRLWLREAVYRARLKERYRTHLEARSRPERESPALTAVCQILAALPARWQDVLSLRYLQGMPVDEIARGLGISADAAKKRIQRAKIELRRRVSIEVDRLFGERAIAFAPPVGAAFLAKGCSVVQEMGLAASIVPSAGPVRSLLPAICAGGALLALFGIVIVCLLGRPAPPRIGRSPAARPAAIATPRADPGTAVRPPVAAAASAPSIPPPSSDPIAAGSAPRGADPAADPPQDIENRGGTVMQAHRTKAATLAALGAAAALAASDPLPVVVDIGDSEIGADTIETWGIGGWLPYLWIIDVGDVNGDGFGDFAFEGNPAPAAEVSTYIVFGSPERGRDLRLDEVDRWGLRITSSDLAWSAYASRAGDWNGDGLADLFFFRRKPDMTFDGGWIFLGRPEFENRSIDLADPSARGAGIRVDAEYDAAIAADLIPFRAGGCSVSADLDGDGRTDLVIPAALARLSDGRAMGLVFVVFGKDETPESVSLRGPDTAVITLSDAFPAWPTTNKRLGAQLAAPGDVNGDGIEDLLIGDAGLALGGDASGGVFLFFGRTPFEGVIDLADPASGRTLIWSRTPWDQIGDSGHVHSIDAGIIATGDVNGDGLGDFIIPCAYCGLEERASGALILGRKGFPPSLPLAPEWIDVLFPCKGMMFSAIGDFDGDGIADIAASVPNQDSTRREFPGRGAAYILPGRGRFPDEICPADHPPGLIEIPGKRIDGLFGYQIGGCDADGDGLGDFLIGFVNEGLVPPAGFGSISVVRGRPDLRGKLEATEFYPPQGDRRGGTEVTFIGSGFTSKTQAFFGDGEAASYERIDSGKIVVMTPPGEGEVVVRITDGGEEVAFDPLFLYRNFEIPARIRIEDLATGGLTIRKADSEGYRNFVYRPTRAGDVTGDGVDDLVLPTFADNETYSPQLVESIFILHGSRDLPSDIDIAEFETFGTRLYTATPYDQFCEDVRAIGDLDGDRIGDIVACAAVSRILYVIFGGPFSVGPLEVEEYVRGGGGFRIEGCPDLFDIDPAGDIDGDGLADALLSYWGDAGANEYSPIASAFLLGRRDLPQALRFDSLPRLSGRVSGGDEVAMIHCLGQNPIGDVDGDGYDDIAIYTETRRRQIGSNSGLFRADYILFGRRAIESDMRIDEEEKAGRAIALFRLDAAQPAPGWERSVKVAPAGDQDGDGIGDLLVVLQSREGAWLRDAYLYRGAKRDAFPRDLSYMDPQGYAVAFLGVPGYLGSCMDSCRLSCDGGRDFNADGVPDLILGDEHYTDRPARTIVIFGGPFSEASYPITGVPASAILEDDRPCPGPGSPCVFPGGPIFCGDIDDDGVEDVLSMTATEAYAWFSPATASKEPFRRGDADLDGTYTIGDPIFILNGLFGGGDLPCEDAADVNDNEILELGDPVLLLMWQFADGAPPAEPFERCGWDKAGDDLRCAKAGCVP